REQGGGHRAGRVDDRLQVRVVEVEGVRGDAVDERGARHVDLLAAARDGGLRRGLQFGDGGQRGVGRFVLRRADGATEPVEEGAVRLVVDGVAPAARGMRGYVFGQDLRDRGGVVVGRDLGVAGHVVPYASMWRFCALTRLVQRAMSACRYLPNAS